MSDKTNAPRGDFMGRLLLNKWKLEIENNKFFFVIFIRLSILNENQAVNMKSPAKYNISSLLTESASASNRRKMY